MIHDSRTLSNDTNDRPWFYVGEAVPDFLCQDIIFPN